MMLETPQFGEFCETVKKIGELVHSSADANDVTEEYVDLQVRCSEKQGKRASRRLQKDYGDQHEPQNRRRVGRTARGKSSAALEMERMMGRQRYLDNMIELTTVSIHVEERGTFAAPTPLTPKDFGTRIEETFFSSVDALVKVGKAVVISAVAVAPWLPIVAVAGGVLWLVRRRRKAARSQV